MLQLIIQAALTIIPFVLNLLGEKSEKRKRVEKLIVEWMKRMNREFLASTEIADQMEELWKKSDKLIEQSQKDEVVNPIQPVGAYGKKKS